MIIAPWLSRLHILSAAWAILVAGIKRLEAEHCVKILSCASLGQVCQDHLIVRLRRICCGFSLRLAVTSNKAMVKHILHAHSHLWVLGQQSVD